MTATIMDGKTIAQQIQARIAQSVQQRIQLSQRRPGLAVILVGDDPASSIYVSNKHKACEEVGFHSTAHHLSSNITERTLLDLIASLNADHSIDGILVQLPLPQHIDKYKVLDSIKPDKDVDGFHAHNLGLLLQRRPQLRPCTPYGIMQLLSHYKIDVKNLDATIIGASNIVGRPLALELLLAGNTPTICHRFTQDLKKHVCQAGLVISAVGKPALIPGDWIKPGAVVIDVGISRLDNNRLVGDIEFETARQRASYITPVPGGVGPMTIAMLLQNTLFATEHLH